MGKPANPGITRRQPRFERKFIVHQERYQRFNPDEFNQMHLPFGFNTLTQKEYPNGAQNVVQFNYLRKFSADFSREMTRSVQAALENWRQTD